VQVQVSRVDLDGRRIDFRLVSEGDELLARAMRDKAGGDGGGADVSRKRSSAKSDARQGVAAPKGAKRDRADKGGASRTAGKRSGRGAGGGRGGAPSSRKGPR
jgi:ribonuclease R